MELGIKVCIKFRMEQLFGKSLSLRFGLPVGNTVAT